MTSAKGFNEDRTQWAQYFEPVYEALRLTRAGLSQETTLLGFAGAPWTLATYLAAGAGGDEQKAAKLWAYRDPEGFGYLLDILAECVAFHLIRQIDAGADAVQIFDSWASGLPPALFERAVITPTKKIVDQVRAARPGAKIIGFPRAATLAGYQAYVQAVGVDAVSLDTSAPMDWAAKNLNCAIQGNLDPIVLIAGGAALDEAVDDILEACDGEAAYLQSGSRHPARNAHRPCRTAPEAYSRPKPIHEIGSRPVQSGRAGFSGSGAAFPAQSVFRSRHHQPARIFRIPLGAADFQAPRPIATRNLCPDRRALADLRRNPQAGRCAGSGAVRRGVEAKAFVAMRYWHPFSDGAARAVKAFDADKIVLLPLYPQYSTTTTASSLKDWARAAKKAGLTAPTAHVCCYPTEAGFVAATVAHIRQAMAGARGDISYRLLLSAHGLPKRTIQKRRSLSAPCGTKRGGDHRGAGHAGAGRTGLVSKPRRAAGMDRARHR